MLNLFGCPHKKTTFPIKLQEAQAHVTCLDCGAEFPYNWSEMRIEARPKKATVVAPVRQVKEVTT